MTTETEVKPQKSREYRETPARKLAKLETAAERSEKRYLMERARRRDAEYDLQQARTEIKRLKRLCETLREMVPVGGA